METINFQNKTNSKMTPDQKALKFMRKLRKLSQKEAGLLFGVSEATIKRRENLKAEISSHELDKFINGYGFTKIDFMNIKLGKFDLIKNLDPVKKVKIIEHNELRRSYQKKITKETIALKIIRERLRLTKYEASKKCGYHRTTIGNIENGRINLSESRIEYILKKYDVPLKEFKSIVNSKIDRISVENKCINHIEKLSDEKLITLKSLLMNF